MNCSIDASQVSAPLYWHGSWTIPYSAVETYCRKRPFELLIAPERPRLLEIGDAGDAPRRLHSVLNNPGDKWVWRSLPEALGFMNVRDRFYLYEEAWPSWRNIVVIGLWPIVDSSIRGFRVGYQ